jgi:hypothetical protein
MLDPPSITPILHDDGHNARLFARLDYAPTQQDRFELFVNYAKNRFQIPIDPNGGSSRSQASRLGPSGRFLWQRIAFLCTA